MMQPIPVPAQYLYQPVVDENKPDMPVQKSKLIPIQAGNVPYVNEQYNEGMLAAQMSDAVKDLHYNQCYAPENVIFLFHFSNFNHFNIIGI
ncbi:unnamed protein product [Thelazia callipaeda]|uniref:PAM2 domain-containing protein n=1 Tax=Thelazia callipaeda TaxID=103827 RepID=A0A0N5CSC7_THECL|nr:unnamed protein product [Thelazia callipaeda]